MLDSKKQLRHTLQSQCKQLSLSAKHQKSQALLSTLGISNDFKVSQHIAFYWPFKDEIDPRPLLESALLMKKNCYLPVLHPSKPGYLLFVEYRSDDKLVSNRFGIKEPLLGQRAIIDTWILNLVLIPLLAFTPKGHRLGRGGGYYDRTFALTKRYRPNHPKLIGLAYDLQCLQTLPHESWDVPLAGVATDKRFIISAP